MTLVAKVVGELACQRNSYLCDLQTTVISCVEVVASKTEIKRAKKNKERDQKSQAATPTATVAEDGKLWEIECEDSVLFPEGMLVYSNLSPEYINISFLILNLQEAASLPTMAPSPLLTIQTTPSP